MKNQAKALLAAGAAGVAITLAALPAVLAAQPQVNHPPLVLKDAAGKNVRDTGAPISTRQTCGGCHDYDFITDSLHFQQGKNEMKPDELKKHGIAPYNSSPGMFGKFSLIPNRQMTHAGVQDPGDVDMSQPEWLTKCGVCHTGGGISEYDLKGRKLLSPEARPDGPFDPSYTIRDRATGAIVPWDWQKSGITEGDCFLCHAARPSRGARREAIAKGDFRWANNATLSATGLVKKTEDGKYTYEAAAFNADGTVKPEVFQPLAPALENCAQCHGFTARNATTIQPIQHADIMRGTEKAGWIFNGAKISATESPNIVGREHMDFPWDGHAAKKMVCTDCHFAPNNPGRMLQADASKNLTYRPRPDDLRGYLTKPDHNFARGKIPPETVNMTRHNTMRGCADCHDAEKGHAFLPYKARHFAAMSCSTCHIPAVHFWAYRSDHWAVLMDTGTSRITFRGIEGDIVDPESKVTGFLPAYITSPAPSGRPQIRPTNLITGLYWFDRTKGRPVFTWQVQKAYFTGWSADSGWTYRDEVLKAFADKDGVIDIEQARLDTPEKIALVKELLAKHAGVTDAELRIDITPWALSHGIVGKDQATRECKACHAKKSILHRPLDLDSYLPENVPVLIQGKALPVVARVDKKPVFDNRPLLASFYIPGSTRIPWVEWLGGLSVAGAMVFAVVHGALRAIPRPRRRK